MILWLHLVGAMVWVGGHLILSLAYLPTAWLTQNIDDLKGFEERYEKIGLPALVLQVVTGLSLAYERYPDPSLWLQVTAPRIRVVAIKHSLLFATLLLAAHARLRIWPTISIRSLPVFSMHVVLVTILALAFMSAGLGFRMGWLS